MGEDKAVMETRCDFIRFIGSVLDPVSANLQKLAEINRNLVGVDADVLCRLAKCASPFSDPAKHALVQIP